MWEELGETPWGRRWYSWRALADGDGRIVSSLKLYRPMLRLGGVTGRVCAIGAVFTPPSVRRRGHAARLIRDTLDEAEARGDHAALLFTDIGIDYYRALGFTPLPCEDAIGTLPVSPPRTGLTLRAMAEGDLDEVAAAHAADVAGRPIAIERDRDHWRFLLERAQAFFRRLDGSDLSRRFMVAEEMGRPVGYLVGVAAPGEWNLREAAAYDGTPETLGRILATGVADARAWSATTAWGWIPREQWPLMRGCKVRAQPRLRALPMIRVLRGASLPSGADTVGGAFIPYLDQF